MAADPPLSTLLAQALVAFTIEFDNEAERQSAHRTTWGPALSRRGPWLVSQVMWADFMRYVPEGGAPLRELEGPVRMTNLGGLERWGYVVVAPEPAHVRPAPPRRDWVVRATSWGRRAQEIWRPLAGEIEGRWRTRFGGAEIDGLRASLQALVEQFQGALPAYPPVVNFSDGMRTRIPPQPGRGYGVDVGANPDLSVLLSQVLLAFTLDFERDSKLSLAISADLVRVLEAEARPVRDLPRLTGVSREAISAAVGFLHRHGHVTVAPDATGRGKSVRLTARGRLVKAADRRLLADVEDRWQARFGAAAILAVRGSVAGLFEQRDGDRSRVAQGLVPDPAGWRAHKPYLAQTQAILRDPRAALPHQPMVLHRGGWPDGS